MTSVLQENNGEALVRNVVIRIFSARCLITVIGITERNEIRYRKFKYDQGNPFNTYHTTLSRKILYYVHDTMFHATKPKLDN